MAIKDAQRLQLLNQSLHRLQNVFASSTAVARGWLSLHQKLNHPSRDSDLLLVPIHAHIAQLELHQARVGRILEHTKGTNDLVWLIHFLLMSLTSLWHDM